MAVLVSTVSFNHFSFLVYLVIKVGENFCVHVRFSCQTKATNHVFTSKFDNEENPTTSDDVHVTEASFSISALGVRTIARFLNLPLK